MSDILLDSINVLAADRVALNLRIADLVSTLRDVANPEIRFAVGDVVHMRGHDGESQLVRVVAVDDFEVVIEKDSGVRYWFELRSGIMRYQDRTLHANAKARDIARAVAAAERARDEVGIQLVAAQAEIARMQPVVEAARAFLAVGHGDVTDVCRAMETALRALDTVPGDALAPRPGDRLLAVIADAIGAIQPVDTDNVKGGE